MSVTATSAVPRRRRVANHTAASGRDAASPQREDHLPTDRLPCREGRMGSAWLVVGVMSGMTARNMRDAIRETWLTAGGFRTDAVGCFVLAAHALVRMRLPHKEVSCGRLPAAFEN